MIRSPVKSSNVVSVGYDQDHGVLEVEFKSGAVYRCVLPALKCPAGDAPAFLDAESPGSFLAHSIRGVYPHERVEVEPEPEGAV